MRPATQKTQFHRDKVCAVHGEYVDQGIKLRPDADAKWFGCPKCAEEKSAQWDKAKMEEEERQARETAERHLREAANIPKRMMGKSFDTFQTGGDPAKEHARRVAIDYAEKAQQNLSMGVSMLFCGRFGTGKTLLACAIAKHAYAKHSKVVMYRTVYEAVLEVKEAWSGRTSESAVYTAFRKPDLLILDEVGRQFGSEAEKVAIFQILNSRYNDMTSTIVISNLDLAGVKEYIGAATVDRLREHGGELVQFGWESERGNV